MNGVVYWHGDPYVMDAEGEWTELHHAHTNHEHTHA